MTDNFFEKTLAAREISQIPGMLEFDIPVHGDNRGWFKENFQKEKMMPLGFPESFFAEEKLQNNVSFSRKNLVDPLSGGHNGNSEDHLPPSVKFLFK